MTDDLCVYDTIPSRPLGRRKIEGVREGYRINAEAIARPIDGTLDYAPFELSGNVSITTAGGYRRVERVECQASEVPTLIKLLQEIQRLAVPETDPVLAALRKERAGVDDAYAAAWVASAKSQQEQYDSLTLSICGLVMWWENRQKKFSKKERRAIQLVINDIQSVYDRTDSGHFANYATENADDF